MIKQRSGPRSAARRSFKTGFNYETKTQLKLPARRLGAFQYAAYLQVQSPAPFGGVWSERSSIALSREQ